MGGTLCAQDAESVFGQKRVAIKRCAKEHARLEANFAFKPAIAKTIILIDARRGFKAKVAFDGAIVRRGSVVASGPAHVHDSKIILSALSNREPHDQLRIPYV